jgi:hypothetical protein
MLHVKCLKDPFLAFNGDVDEYFDELNDSEDFTETSANPFLHFWRGILELYTSAQLSFKFDRLAAVRGIIGSICNQTGWENVHGLWKPFLIHELLWERHHCATNPQRLQGIAPTWSWASIDSRIRFELTLNRVRKYTA